MLIQLIHGNETFSGVLGGTVKVLNFFRAQPGGEEQALAVAARDHHTMVRQIGSNDFIWASGENKNHGQWITARYDVPENSYIRLMVTRKMQSEFIQQNYQVYLRCREGAALRRLRISFTGHPSANFQWGHVEGRFDILRLEDLDRLKFAIPDQLRAKFDIDDLSDVFDETVLEREAVPANLPNVETVSTHSGRQVQVARTSPRRKLNI